MDNLHLLFTKYYLVGWVAFVCLLLVFLIYIVWEYRNKAAYREKLILEIKQQSANSESAGLINPEKLRRSLSGLQSTETYNIGSESDFTEEDSMRCTPSYIFPQYNAPVLKSFDRYEFPFSLSIFPHRRAEQQRKLTPSGTPLAGRSSWRTRDSLKHLYPSDVSSHGLDSSRSYGRPLSYRDMRPTHIQPV